MALVGTWFITLPRRQGQDVMDGISQSFVRQRIHGLKRRCRTASERMESGYMNGRQTESEVRRPVLSS